MLERELEQLFNRRVQAQGGLSRKWQNQQQRGVPDRIVIHNGKVFFVELKRTGKKPTKLQEVEHKKIRAHGKEVYVIAGKEEMEQLIEEYLPLVI